VETIVLLKRVPSTETTPVIRDDGLGIKTDDVKWVISPYDEFAVEEALRLREKHGGTVTAVSAGPEKAAETLRTALAMGVDTGVRLPDPAELGTDGPGTAKLLAAWAGTRTFDLIIAGQRAVDDDSYLVGPATAEYLNIPNISLVVSVEVEDGKIRCRRTIEGGTAVYEAPLPALITTQRGLNEPRYASLPGIMKAKKKKIETPSLSDVGLTPEDLGPRRVTVRKMHPPPPRKAGRIVGGETVEAKAKALATALIEESKVI
jgi:electron transfer flavoprotein beta subunit